MCQNQKSNQGRITPRSPHLIGLSVSARLAAVTNSQTDTDHATSYLAIGRIHAMHATRHESRNVAQPAVPRWRINGDEIAGDGTRLIGLINTALNSLQRCVFIRTSVSQSAGRPLSQNGDGIRRRHPSKFARLTTPPVYVAAHPPGRTILNIR